MIINRTAQQCGQADYGWLQARYTFSFGHYFDPELLGYASLRVLNQEVLAPGAAFQPRTYPKVDVLNLILQGEAEYRDSEGNHTVVGAGEALLLATQPGLSYSEHNTSTDLPLTRLQLWLDTEPTKETPPVQQLKISEQETCALLASPDGSNGSLQLRQQVWIHQVILQPGESHSLPLHGSHAYVQSIHGTFTATAHSQQQKTLTCGDGAFVKEEEGITLTAETPLRVLVIDLV